MTAYRDECDSAVFQFGNTCLERAVRCHWPKPETGQRKPGRLGDRFVIVKRLVLNGGNDHVRLGFGGCGGGYPILLCRLDFLPGRRLGYSEVDRGLGLGEGEFAAGAHPDHRGHLADVLERGKLEFLEDRLAPAHGHDDCSRSEPYRFELLPDPLSDFLRVLQVEILAWHREQFNAAHLCRAP